MQQPINFNLSTVRHVNLSNKAGSFVPDHAMMCFGHPNGKFGVNASASQPFCLSRILWYGFFGTVEVAASFRISKSSPPRQLQKLSKQRWRALMYAFISQRPSRTCSFKCLEQEGGVTSEDVVELFERSGTTVDMAVAIVDGIGDRFMDT
jgi:hypothetical protein